MQLQQNDLATDSPFEAGRASPRPARAFPKKKNPVTLIVGIICKEEMIIATDSRTTFASHVEDHAKKIRVIDYRHGKVLVAWSGFTAFAIDAVDIFEQRCEKFEPKDYRALAELAKKVVDEIRVREISVLRETKSSPESIQNYLRDNSEFVLMLAYYVHSEPCLYTLNFPMGAIERTQYHFATLGNNASLGSYLLKEYSQSDMGAELATALAVYVIESVGEHDKYVGGETRVAVTRNPYIRTPAEVLLSQSFEGAGYRPFPDYRPSAQLISANDVRKISTVIAKFRSSIRKTHNQQLQKSLTRQNRNELWKILKKEGFKKE